MGVSTFNNILTHGLQSQWLAQVLDGKVQLPSSGHMLKHIEKEQAWKRTWMPGTSARASIFQLHMMKYHDQLCADMGEKPKRKGWNLLAEMFSPYSAKDYAGIFKTCAEGDSAVELSHATSPADTNQSATTRVGPNTVELAM